MTVKNLGIIGGGQLGSLLATAAKKLNINTTVFVMTLMHLLKIFAIISYMENMMINKKSKNLFKKLM